MTRLPLLPGSYGSVGTHVFLKTSLERTQLIYIINPVSDLQTPHPRALFNLIQSIACRAPNGGQELLCVPALLKLGLSDISTFSYEERDAYRLMVIKKDTVERSVDPIIHEIHIADVVGLGTLIDSRSRNLNS